jgi:hypothetical protein
MLFTTVRDWSIAVLLLSLLLFGIEALSAQRLLRTPQFHWLALALLIPLSMSIWFCIAAVHSLQMYQYWNSDAPYHGITQYIARIENSSAYTQIILNSQIQIALLSFVILVLILLQFAPRFRSILRREKNAAALT